MIPLNAEALAVLTAIKPDAGVGYVFKSPVTGARFNNVKKAWAEITKDAKFPDLRWHDLRHDFAVSSSCGACRCSRCRSC